MSCVHRIAVRTLAALIAVGAGPAWAGVDVDFGANALVGDDADLFFRISSRNYDRDHDDVRSWARAFPAPDDLNVALHLARHCDRDPAYFLALRKQKVGWFEISRRCEVPVDVWFVPVDRDPGPPYGKAYGYWKKHRRDPATRIVLTDRQVRDLVAVRLIHDYYRVPVETAMAWRSRGTNVRQLMVAEYDRRHGKGEGGNAGKDGATRAKHGERPGKGHAKDKGHGSGAGRGRS